MYSGLLSMYSKLLMTGASLLEEYSLMSTVNSDSISMANREIIVPP